MSESNITLVQELNSNLVAANAKISLLEAEIKRLRALSWREGFIEALKQYAWWRDGVQYVGCGGETLQSAIDQIKKIARQENEVGIISFGDSEEV